MIPELTRLKCKQKGNQKGKGTDEMPLVHNCGYITLGRMCNCLKKGCFYMEAIDP